MVKRLISWLAKLPAEVKEYLLKPMPAAIVVAIVLIPLGAWVVAFREGPEVYKIIVLSTPPEGKDQPDYSQKFWDGFFKEANPTPDGTLPFTFRGVRLQVQRELEAPTTESPAPNAQSLSSGIARSSDTLLVVLNLSSTRTKEVLPEYLQQPTPIPAILTATNPSLLPPKLTEDYYPVLRMLPTDDQQVKAAADFPKVEAAADFPKAKAAADSPKREGGEPVFWVAEDALSENPTYSHFLATLFVEEAGRVFLWSSSYTLLPLDALPRLGVNWVFFTGNWSHALILIRQLNAISKRAQPDGKHYRAPSVILNETSMDQRLITQGGADIDQRPITRGGAEVGKTRVYLTYPLPKWNQSDRGMGDLGRDTFQVVKQLLAAADSKDFAEQRGGSLYKLKRFLGIRRVADARNALITKMQFLNTTYDLGETKCEFDEHGTKFEVDKNQIKHPPEFHVYQVLNGNFQPLDQIAIAKRPRDHAGSVHASVEPSPKSRLMQPAALPSPSSRLMQRAVLSQRTF